MRNSILAALLVPSVMLGQWRNPFHPRSGPREMPRQAPEVARDVQYQRMRYSISGYSMLSHIVSPGFTAGRFASWNTFGAGTRVDYRLLPNVSTTLDLTSSMFGGPATMETAELGLRLHPDSSGHRVYPFVDVRGGYAYALNTLYGQNVFFSGDAVSDARWSHGFGAFVGAGFDAGLTRTMSLTVAAQAGHFSMRGFNYNSPTTTDRTFPMRMYRLIAGIRWNPVRFVGDLRQKQNQ